MSLVKHAPGLFATPERKNLLGVSLSDERESVSLKLVKFFNGDVESGGESDAVHCDS